MFILSENILSEPRFHPPIVPLIAFNTPALVTLKGDEAKEELPKFIPTSPSAMNISLPAPSVIF